MNDIKYYLGQRIKELRKIKGLSQQELAEIANIDQRSLSHIECGDTFPSKSLFELAEALDVDLKDLFERLLSRKQPFGITIQRLRELHFHLHLHNPMQRLREFHSRFHLWNTMQSIHFRSFQLRDIL